MRVRYVFLFCAGFLWFNINNSLAQPTAEDTLAGRKISGRVVNILDQTPISGANIFFSGTIVGTYSDQTGRFELKYIPAGTYDLIFSHVAYVTSIIPVHIKEEYERDIVIKLIPRINELREVKIEEKKDKVWQRNYRRFERLFLGESDNAQKSEILNPWVLEFENDPDGDLIAKAADLLDIQNDALGYQVSFLLEYLELQGSTVKIEGKTRFTPMESKNLVQRRKWKQARDKAYYGSRQHFLKSLLEGTTLKEGFHFFRMDGLPTSSTTPKYPFDRKKSLSEGDYEGEVKLKFKGFLEVKYMGAIEEWNYVQWKRRQNFDYLMFGISQAITRNPPISWLSQKEDVSHVANSGYVTNPLSLREYGYWAWKGVADILPINYLPAQTFNQDDESN